MNKNMEKTPAEEHHEEGLAAMATGGIFKIEQRKSSEHRGSNKEHVYYAVVGPDGREWGARATQPEFCLSTYKMLNKAYGMGVASQCDGQ